MLTYIVALVGGLFTLLTCGHIFVSWAVGTAERSHIPKIITGTPLISIGTTFQKLAVPIRSAVLGHTNLNLGNATGTVIANDAFVFGTAGTFAPLSFTINFKAVKSPAIVLVSSAILLYIFTLNGFISKPEEIILLLLPVTYPCWLASLAKRWGNMILTERIITDESPVKTQSKAQHTIKFAVGLIGVLFFSSCSQPQILHKSQWAMGTVVEITWIGKTGSKDTIKKAFDTIRTIDRLMNPDDENSELTKVNTGAGKGFIIVSPLTCQVIQEGTIIYKETNGAFDITLGPLIKLWGWDTKSPHLSPAEAIKTALKKTGGARVICDPVAHRVMLKQSGMGLDLGGIAKGFAVDRAVNVLRSKGFRDFIVNAGGDLYCGGKHLKRPWYIGIQDPDDPQAIIASLPLSGQAIATSGDYERFFIEDNVRYHHILDPSTGYPARGLRSVSILSKSTMDADAIATGLFVLGRVKAIQWLHTHPDYSGIIVDDSLHVYASGPLKNLIKWKKRFKKRVSYF